MNQGLGIITKAKASQFVGGALKSVQYNDNGKFNGFGIYDKSADLLTITGLLVAYNETLIQLIQASIVDNGANNTLEVDLTGSDVSITLPDPGATNGLIREIITFGTAAVGTVTTASGNFTGGLTAIVLRGGDSVRLQSDGSNWMILSSSFYPFISTQAPGTGATIQAPTARLSGLYVNTNALAALTVKFPASPQNGDQFNLSFKSAITALTLNGNGKTVIAPITTVAAASAVRWIYNNSASAWIPW